MANNTHHIHICDIGGGAAQVCSFGSADDERAAREGKGHQGCPTSDVVVFKGELPDGVWNLIDEIADAAFKLGRRR